MLPLRCSVFRYKCLLLIATMRTMCWYHSAVACLHSTSVLRLPVQGTHLAQNSSLSRTAALVPFCVGAFLLATLFCTLFIIASHESCRLSTLWRAPPDCTTTTTAPANTAQLCATQQLHERCSKHNVGCVTASMHVNLALRVRQPAHFFPCYNHIWCLPHTACRISGLQLYPPWFCWHLPFCLVACHWRYGEGVALKPARLGCSRLGCRRGLVFLGRPVLVHLSSSGCLISLACCCDSPAAGHLSVYADNSHHLFVYRMALLWQVDGGYCL
ncbi:hypothetical protein COO60DRAFT_862681 [Scenedesmus sp. NREL 46B-D3]|nr:hypothetical protein COO60DRAFT_862681 [Scenedesmus sp. NREL 46B-D3]